MYRLTELNYDGNSYDMIDVSVGTYGKKLGRVINKLGELEDIEQELEIELTDLNKLRKADVIYTRFQREIQEWNKFKIDLRECKIWYGYIHGKGYTLCRPFSEYGHTISVIKEELIL